MKISNGIKAVEYRENIPESSDDSVPMFRDGHIYLVSIGPDCNTGTNSPPLSLGAEMLVQRNSSPQVMRHFNKITTGINPCRSAIVLITANGSGTITKLSLSMYAG
ncbi:Uncharacterized protein LW94_2714 [Fusarium fujikuroi]|nr:Uncharacterized protein LW94_2714 [Fusarium fujikuroi]